MTELLSVNKLVTQFKTESGCGKTTSGRCILGLYRPTADQITFEGQDITAYKENKIKEVRSRMALIYQDTYSSVAPCQSTENIVGEPLKIYDMVKINSEYKDRGEVSIPPPTPPGCSFHPRCFIAIPECRDVVPPLQEISGGHEVACIRV